MIMATANPFAIDLENVYANAAEFNAAIQKQEAIAKIERDQAAARKRNEQLQSINLGIVLCR